MRLKRNKNRRGQVMFLTVVVLGAVISSVTIIAGLLMAYQIKRSADVAYSARAVFAADAGVECMLYYMFNTGQAKTGNEAQNECNRNGQANNFTGSGASFKIYKSSDRTTGIPDWFQSTGSISESVRAIRINL